jgi:hypothetical protein
MATLGSIAVKLGLDPSQFRNGLVSARASLAAFKATTDDGSKSGTKFSSMLEKVGTKAKEMALGLVKGASSAGAVASTAITLGPALVSAVKWIGQVGSAGIASAPALLGMAAAALFVKSTITAVWPAVVKAFTPFTDALTVAKDKASLLATAGLDPLIKKFTQLNMPSISSGMNTIATATNGVVRGTLAWANSTAGVMAIRNIVQSAGDAFAYVAPHITRVVIAFGNMLGRITAVSTAAGASGLAGVLDKVASYLDKVNAATVLTGFADLKAKWNEIVSLFKMVSHWVGNAIEFFRTFKTELKLVGDALSILAIVFGGPVVAVVAAVGLIIRHWDQLKAAYKAFVGYFTSNPIGVGFLDNLRSASESVLPPLQKAWQTIWSAIGPVLTQIWDKIQNQFIPAMGQFIAAIAPVVGFCVSVLGPIVASVFQGILNVVSGVISIITGIIQVFTALLTGNWQAAWDGVKNICFGAGQIITGIIGGVFGGLIGIVAGAIRAVIGVVAGLPGAMLAVLAGLGSLLYNAGIALIQGLINGIRDMLGAVGNAASSVASTIRSYLPFSPAKQGPLAGAGSTQVAGAKIASMLASGMLTGLPAVEGMAGRLASAAGVNASGSYGALGGSGPQVAGMSGVGGSGSTPVLQLASDGKIGDLLLEVIEKAARGKGLTVVSAR